MSAPKETHPVIPLPPLPQPLPPGVKPGDPKAHAQRQREYAAQGLWQKRFIVELAEVPKYCPRQRCRRAGTCQSPTIECHDEVQEVLRAEFYPKLREILRQPGDMPLYDGDAVARERAKNEGVSGGEPETS